MRATMSNVSRFVQKHKIEISLFLLAIAWRALFFTTLYALKPNTLSIIADRTDTAQYLKLAHNIVERHIYYGPDENSLLLRRSPGYPTFLAFFLVLARVPYALLIAAILQVILAGFTVIFIFRLLNQWYSKNIARFASLFFLFEPNAAYFSFMLLAESLFTFIFIACLLVLLARKQPSAKSLLFAGILFGIGALVRPIAQFIPFIAVLFLFLRNGWSLATTKRAIILVVGAAAIMLPWMTRNAIVANSFDISSDGVSTYFHYTLPSFLAERDHKTQDEIRSEITQELKQKINSSNSGPTQLMQQKIIKVIGQNPIKYAYFHFIKTLPFFFGDGIREILQKTGAIDERQPDFSQLIFRGAFSEIISIMTSRAYFIITIILALFWTLIYAAACLGFFHEIRASKERRALAIFFAAIILVFAFLAGPANTTRHRMPILPAIFTLAAIGVTNYRKRYKKAALRIRNA